MPVKKGDKVKIEYEGTLEDGTVFDSSKNHGPLEFEVGTGKVIPGFENAVIGMEIGKEKTVKIEPKDAYGDPNPKLIQQVPRDQLPKEQEPQVGMFLTLTMQTNQQVPAKIMKVEKESITIDLNHPLAGKKLTFKIKLLEVK